MLFSRNLGSPACLHDRYRPVDRKHDIRGHDLLKTTPMDSLVLAPGLGTPLIRDASSPHLNNSSSTKQNVGTATRLVVIASDDDRA